MHNYRFQQRKDRFDLCRLKASIKSVSEPSRWRRLALPDRMSAQDYQFSVSTIEDQGGHGPRRVHHHWLLFFLDEALERSRRGALLSLPESRSTVHAGASRWRGRP
jgi:hypothetical protein